MMAPETFNGVACKKCGGTLRYVSWKRCVPCERQRQRNKKPPQHKNANLMWLKPFLIDGAKVMFSPVERDIFAVLFNARGQQVFTEALVDKVWGHSEDPPLNMQSSLSTNIHRIRLALEPTQFRVITDWGRGYRLERLTRVEIAA